MRKGAILLFCAAALLFFYFSGSAAMAESRALLLSSDAFLTAPDTSPSAGNNAQAIAAVFENSLDAFERIIVKSDEVASLEALKDAVNSAFSDADEQDTSYLYISTHGVLEDRAYLLLSDGQNEYRLSPEVLEEVLRDIPGDKVILIDACYSGAFIGKGSDELAVSHAFTGDKYKVITSAGAQEKSWFWQSENRYGTQPSGSGYFSDILAMGLSMRGGYAADLNMDGEITLSECAAYLVDNHGVSTPRVYPEKDDFVLLRYDLARARQERNLPDGALNGITFEKDILSYADPVVDFEFTALRPAKVAYQLVYYKNGQWDFDRARLIYDNFESGGAYGDEKGAVSPGRKARALNLELQGDDTYGYVMLQILSLSYGAPTVHFSRVLAVPRMGGDPGLDVMTASAFTPEDGEEMPILIAHASPVEWSVTVEDSLGQTVLRLKTHSGTRPEQLTASASTLYWDGRLKDLSPAPAGTYRVRVTAYYPEETYTAYSAYFTLLAPNG